MAASQDDQFDDDDGIEEELDRHYEALRGFVYDYIDENDVPDEIMAALLSDLAMEMRKVAYVLDTEKPSVGGLKLMLDRYKSDLEAAVRRHKKEAEEFMAGMQEAMSEAKDRLEEELEQLEALDPDDDEDEATPPKRSAKSAAVTSDDEPEDDDLDDDDDDEEEDDEEDEDDDEDESDEDEPEDDEDENPDDEGAGTGDEDRGIAPVEADDEPKKNKPGKAKGKGKGEAAD